MAAAADAGHGEEKWLPRMTHSFVALDSSTHAIDTAAFAKAMEQARFRGRGGIRQRLPPAAAVAACRCACRWLLLTAALCTRHAQQVLPIFEKIGTVFLFARHEFAVKVGAGPPLLARSLLVSLCCLAASAACPAWEARSTSCGCC